MSSQPDASPNQSNAKPTPPVLLVIAGAAGSGKSTLCERLVSTEPEFSRVVTTTTRPPRPGEIDGVHYHFLTPGQFDAKLAAGEFLEWAWVHQKHRYGTLASSVLEPLANGRSLAINIDVQGVESFRNAAKTNPILARHMATVFIDVPMEELRKRMKLRGQDSDAEIERRMKTAEREVREAGKFDYLIRSTTRDGDFAALQAAWRGTCERIGAAQKEQA
ncbi:guanylate kinase [Ereboglobus sp. PH5-5]|uniref:guanylate kinase n=1 Tax=Ereboglobus sp. PH5-5 TaxID=2940529 RepID=UPI00240717F0|nr:guanylate kinase [Ereboglobus sp. PH5-5]MDF9833679.1 guanylate kinase [Ereboglobus sp. PH5-5]